MARAYPHRFELQERGGVLVQFVDVPEAHTYGPHGGGRRWRQRAGLPDRGAWRLRQARPRDPAAEPGAGPARCHPAAPGFGQLALYEAVRAERITRTELARRLGLQENAVRRLLDLDHRSHIDQVDRALAAFGKRLEVRVREPA